MTYQPIAASKYNDDAAYQQEIQQTQEWLDGPRFQHIARPYDASAVVRLRAPSRNSMRATNKRRNSGPSFTTINNTALIPTHLAV